VSKVFFSEEKNRKTFFRCFRDFLWRHKHLNIGIDLPSAPPQNEGASWISLQRPILFSRIRFSLRRGTRAAPSNTRHATRFCVIAGKTSGTCYVSCPERSVSIFPWESRLAALSRHVHFLANVGFAPEAVIPGESAFDPLRTLGLIS
jgi:hypothetical protein